MDGVQVSSSGGSNEEKSEEADPESRNLEELGRPSTLWDRRRLSSFDRDQL